MSEIVWGKTHCARCSKPIAGDAEGDRYYDAEDAKDKATIKELDGGYCWFDFSGEKCQSDKEEEAAWVDLRNEIERLRAALEAIVETPKTEPDDHQCWLAMLKLALAALKDGPHDPAY